MRTILVTGGSGFIGSHTCLVLLENGYKLVVVDSYINSSPTSLKRVIDLLEKNHLDVKNKIHIVQADIRDKMALDRIFSQAKSSGNSIEGVIHFAGLKAVGESINSPLCYWSVNVYGSINLLEIMDKYKCRTIVFSSSATIYGYPKRLPILENSEIKPINPYGNCKATIEKILEDVYSSNNNWKIACLRYFNPVGAHPSGQIGEDPLTYPNNLFPYLCQVAVGRREKLKIFGNDWPTNDGTCVRDYIHVMDLAEGHYRALDYLLRNESKLITLNIGTGKGTTVLELVNTFQETNSCKIPYVFSDRRPGDAAISYSDNKLAKTILNWSPERTLKDICRDGWAWQSSNPNGY